jgi:hypothetical protein
LHSPAFAAKFEISMAVADRPHNLLRLTISDVQLLLRFADRLVAVLGLDRRKPIAFPPILANLPLCGCVYPLNLLRTV